MPQMLQLEHTLGKKGYKGRHGDFKVQLVGRRMSIPFSKRKRDSKRKRED